jgi:hypothetical protein
MNWAKHVAGVQNEKLMKCGLKMWPPAASYTRRTVLIGVSYGVTSLVTY